MWEKIKEPPNVTKVQCNVGTAQCEDGSFKMWGKKIRESLNVQKYSHIWY